jgi:hypothetical protein
MATLAPVKRSPVSPTSPDRISPVRDRLGLGRALPATSVRESRNPDAASRGVRACRWIPVAPLRQLLGDISTDPDGNKVIGVFSRNSLEGEPMYQGTDEIGPQMDTDLSRSRSSRPKA